MHRDLASSPCWHPKEFLQVITVLNVVHKALCVIDLPQLVHIWVAVALSLRWFFNPTLLYIIYHRYCVPITITGAFGQMSVFIYPDWNSMDIETFILYSLVIFLKSFIVYIYIHIYIYIYIYIILAVMIFYWCVNNFIQVFSFVYSRTKKHLRFLLDFKTWLRFLKIFRVAWIIALMYCSFMYVDIS